ncbi:MAG: hypothetical protein LBH35_06055 [Treponema sp.]|jgi:hypothetical protein|nr:hypothetical protein [Treponema sp.]
MLKQALCAVFICLSVHISAQETGQLFLYIPDEETMDDYLNMHWYLNTWDAAAKKIPRIAK